MLPKEIIYAPLHWHPHYPSYCPLWHEQHFSWDRPFQLFLFEIFHSLKPTAVMSRWPVNQNLQKFPCASEIRVSISELSFSLQILTGEYICFPSYTHHIRAFFFLLLSWYFLLLYFHCSFISKNFWTWAKIKYISRR